MTEPRDYPGEMDRLDDNHIELLLAGRAPTDDPELAGLATLVAGAKLAAAQPIDAPVEQRHLAAMLEAAQDAPPVLARTRRVPLWTKIAAAAVAVVGTTGGLAAADQLPQPAQDAVSSVADRVGVHFPHSQDAVIEDQPTEADSTESKRVNEDVQTVLEDDSLEGHDKGAAVADAADQNRQDGDTPAAERRQNDDEKPAKPEVTGPANNPNGYGPDDHPTGPPSERPGN